jgi:hypothetical protein
MLGGHERDRRRARLDLGLFGACLRMCHGVAPLCWDWWMGYLSRARARARRKRRAGPRPDGVVGSCRTCVAPPATACITSPSSNPNHSPRAGTPPSAAPSPARSSARSLRPPNQLWWPKHTVFGFGPKLSAALADSAHAARGSQRRRRALWQPRKANRQRAQQRRNTASPQRRDT